MVHDEAIVNNLVVAVHRRGEDAGHPVEGFDRLLDTRAEPTRRREYDSVNGHVVSLVSRPEVATRRFDARR